MIQFKRKFKKQLKNNNKIYYIYNKIIKIYYKNVQRFIVKTIGVKRWRLPNSISINQFFQSLKQDQVEYVVLRWFNDLPEVEAGEDIDMLVADKDICKVIKHLSKKRKGVPVDIYSETGKEGFDFNGMAYYHPYFSKKILTNYRWHKEIFRVPNDKYYFYSLAYHALYHKGYKSGLRNKHNKQITNNDHDYASTLQYYWPFTKKSDIDVSMEGLHEVLSTENLQPPFDMFERLSVRNQWIKDSIIDMSLDTKDYKSVCVLFIRKKGILLIDNIRKMLQENFEIIYDCKLNKEQKNIAKMNIRGGNWGAGPYKLSGGLPNHLFVIIDHEPNNDIKNRKDYPFLENQRFLDLKNNIRTIYNHKKTPDNKCNIVHSSDNSSQAIHYMRLLIKESESLIENKCIK